MATQHSCGTVEYAMLNPTQSHTKSSIRNAEESAKSGQRGRLLQCKASITMIVSLVAGATFSLIHHFFYWYWDGKAVASDSQQRWITGGGTAFAFGLKTSLAIGTSAAYVQYSWLSMSARPHKVAKINSIFTVLSDATEFIDLRFWVRLPLLAILAIVTWYVLIIRLLDSSDIVAGPCQLQLSCHLAQ